MSAVGGLIISSEMFCQWLLCCMRHITGQRRRHSLTQLLDEFEELQHTRRPGHILWVPPSNSCVNPWQIVFDDLDSLLVVIQKKITCCRGGQRNEQATG